MHKILLATALTSFSLLPSAFAADDACDDYLSRHYRQDMTPLNEEYTVPSLPAPLARGEFALNVNPSTRHPGYQEATIFVKSVGARPIREGRFDIKVKIKETTVDGILYSLREESAGPLGSTTGVGPDYGQRSRIVVTLPRSLVLKDCENVSVHVDSDREFGQWGCAVFSNDNRQLNVHTRRAVYRCSSPRIEVPRRIPTPAFP